MCKNQMFFLELPDVIRHFIPKWTKDTKAMTPYTTK